jgi:hypothetical protein
VLWLWLASCALHRKRCLLTEDARYKWFGHQNFE